MALYDYEHPDLPYDHERREDSTSRGAGVVLHQTVEVVPVDESVVLLHEVTPFEDFKTELHGLIRGGDYESKSLEELEAIKADIDAVRSLQSSRYETLVRLEAVLQREMTWTNGYRIDLNKAIQKKHQEKQ